MEFARIIEDRESRRRQPIPFADNPWLRWGPYLSERAWGTVREDYSAEGAAWDYFPHDMARSRAYRWNEDGLAGISDDKGRLCFSVALWNGQDPILKERLFGLAGPQGNHGEDVKEVYFYLDSTPTHSYMKMLYRYPQREYPYHWLEEENARRGKHAPEFELPDTGIFADNRYFDVFVEYAKATTDDILIRISVVNRGPEPAPLHVLPTLWFRNTWSWGLDDRRPAIRQVTSFSDDTDAVGTDLSRPPSIAIGSSENLAAVGTDLSRPPLPDSSLEPMEGGRDKSVPTGAGEGGRDKSVPTIDAEHHELGNYRLYCEGADALLFTENETNAQRLFGVPSATPHVKDAFHEYLIFGKHEAVNPAHVGTKAAALYSRTVAAGDTLVLRLRLTGLSGNASDGNGAIEQHEADRILSTMPPLPADSMESTKPFADFDAIFEQRKQEADEFYESVHPVGLDEEARRVQRQALAGMLWSKQFYNFIVEQWLQGDPAQPTPPQQRKYGRNTGWRHLYNERVMSMPDKWEYPWYASWDLAFHAVPLALVDSDFAKSQLDLLLREWYMHPNGQLPAFEWSFDDVNPPVIAWAAWQLYKIDREQTGKPDRMFLESIFHKLLINFTWWVNRKDTEGKNVFQGGFLGLDNIGVFDRSAPLPTGGHLEQSDSTSWMGMFCLNMMAIALELALTNSVYEDIALKFFEHFMAIAAAMNNIGDEGIQMWNREDEIFYDVLNRPDGTYQPLKIRSLVGLIPLCAAETLEPGLLKALPRFNYHVTWYLHNRPDLARLISHWQEGDTGVRRLLALVHGHRMKRLLRHMLAPEEFLSDHGIRSLSKYHAEHPFTLHVDGTTHTVAYEPAESRTGLFGGNSNWRGPVWFPINYLLIEALQTFHRYYGDDFTVECPTGSGQYLTLQGVADELSRRLIRLFLPDETGQRPYNRHDNQYDAHSHNYLLFHEYFDGDTGAGLGASHQTGWTGLVASLIQQQGKRGGLMPTRVVTTLLSMDGDV